MSDELAEDLLAGIDAADEILRRVFAVDVAKALDPTRPRDF